jgi:hypothetical protein
MAAEKPKCPRIHAVKRSGFSASRRLRTAARCLGGRGVKSVSCGELINKGRIKELAKVMRE